MQLNLLNEQLELFKKHLQSRAAKDLLHLYETQKHFAGHWDLEAQDLAACYTDSLINQQTKRIWRREAYEPKLMMHEFIQLEPDYIRFIFRDLYNESIDAEIRVSRFVFYCNELLEQYKKAKPRSIENNHYHDDYQMICLYLAFRYPDQYTLYHKEAFQAFLRKLNSRNVLDGHDMGRFFKVMRTVQKLIQKDEALVNLHLQRFPEPTENLKTHLLLAYEFYRFSTVREVVPPF